MSPQESPSSIYAATHTGQRQRHQSSQDHHLRTTLPLPPVPREHLPQTVGTSSVLAANLKALTESTEHPYVNAWEHKVCDMRNN